MQGAGDRRGPLFGRDRELGELDEALAGAAEGRGRLLLLVGEPGIGKSRLAEAFADVAAARGATIAWGRAWEAGGAPAYWPWIEVMRDLLLDRLDPCAPGLAAAAQILPELRERLPGLPSPPPLEPAQALFRLFDAVASLLRHFAREARSWPGSPAPPPTRSGSPTSRTLDLASRRCTRASGRPARRGPRSASRPTIWAGRPAACSWCGWPRSRPRPTTGRSRPGSRRSWSRWARATTPGASAPWCARGRWRARRG